MYNKPVIEIIIDMKSRFVIKENNIWKRDFSGISSTED
jgi:hypothetical protein